MLIFLFSLEIYIDIQGGIKSLVTSHTWVVIYAVLAIILGLYIRVLRFPYTTGEHGAVCKLCFLFSPRTLLSNIFSADKLLRCACLY
jgi:hypothetical protein